MLSHPLPHLAPSCSQLRAADGLLTVTAMVEAGGMMVSVRAASNSSLVVRRTKPISPTDGFAAQSIIKSITAPPPSTSSLATETATATISAAPSTPTPPQQQQLVSKQSQLPGPPHDPYVRRSPSSSQTASAASIISPLQAKLAALAIPDPVRPRRSPPARPRRMPPPRPNIRKAS